MSKHKATLFCSANSFSSHKLIFISLLHLERVIPAGAFSLSSFKKFLNLPDNQEIKFRSKYTEAALISKSRINLRVGKYTQYLRFFFLA